MPDEWAIPRPVEALLQRHRAAEIDAGYAAYDAHPLSEPDEWGDLETFRKVAAGTSR